MIPAFFLNKWTWVIGGAVAGVVVALGLLDAFGDARYNEGKLEERAKWEQVLADAEAAQQEAQAQIDSLNRDLNRAAAARDLARNQLLQTVREDLQNAPDVAAQHVVYVNFRRELRASTADRLARVGADFLSSLPSDDQ